MLTITAAVVRCECGAADSRGTFQQDQDIQTLKNAAGLERRKNTRGRTAGFLCPGEERNCSVTEEVGTCGKTNYDENG